MFGLLNELAPKDSAGGDGAVIDPVQEKVLEFMTAVNDTHSLDSNKINIDDLTSKIDNESRTPYQNVFIQECVVMNTLITEIIRSLQEIELSFKGELTLSEKMEALMNCIFLNKVPPTWEKLAFMSTRGLGSWLDNLKQRLD